MATYRPKTPFNVPMQLLIPIWKKVNGVNVKEYPQKGDLIYGSFRTFGGTETTINGVYSVEKTANVETNYRPDIKSDCRLMLANSGDIYEVVGDPENIEMRNRFMKIKVKRVMGKA